MTIRERSSIVAMISLLSVIWSCEPDQRRLVIELGDATADRIVSLQVFVFRPDPLGHQSDASPEAGPDASAEAPARPSSCLELLSLRHELDFPHASQRATLTPASRAQLGLIAEGRALVLVRGRDARCRLFQACREIEVTSGDESEVRIELNELAEPLTSCPPEHRCQAGACQLCGECCDDVDCSDTNPATTDVCLEGACDVAEDFDADGVPAPADCHDRLMAVYPGADPACGYNRDHDCDGQIDDLDVCDAPTCWLGEIVGRAVYPELRALALAPYGNLVAAALQGGPTGAKLWVGILSEGNLAPVGEVEIEGLPDGRLQPHDMVIYEDTAYILMAGSQGVALVDLSSPGSPRYLGLIELDQERLSQSITISPPLLWISRFGGVDVYDISQVSPEDEWPELLVRGLDLALNTVLAFDVQVRAGRGYAIGGNSFIACFDMSSPADIAVTSSRCFPNAELPETNELRWGNFNSLFVTADSELFANSTRGGSGDDISPPGIWRIALDERGEPMTREVRTAVVEGEPRSITVAGGTILRASTQGLSLHSREDFHTTPGVTVDLDEDPDSTGPTALDALLFGRTAVVAIEDAGLVTLELDCRR